jgi:hypothetical protein
MPITMEMTIEEAAAALDVSVAALWKRINRADRREDGDGYDVDLGHGVTAFMPLFRRVWTVSVPRTLMRKIAAKSRGKP